MYVNDTQGLFSLHIMWICDEIDVSSSLLPLSRRRRNEAFQDACRYFSEKGEES